MLVLVEPESLDELAIDTPVVGVARDGLDDRSVIYAIPDGERAGIWVAKLAPAEGA